MSASGRRGMTAHMAGKNDRAGRLLTDDEQHAAEPWHPYWATEAAMSAQVLRGLIGKDRMHEFMTSAPEDAGEWSHQKETVVFRKAVKFIRSRYMKEWSVAELCEAAYTIPQSDGQA